MTYDVYRYIFYGGAGLAGLCLIVSIILFFTLRIPNVIGDLSGATARKAIERIRSQNENSGEKTYRSSAVNQERGKITERMKENGTPATNLNKVFGGAMPTTKIGTQILSEEARVSYENYLRETTGAPATEVLSSEVSGETTVLDQNPVYAIGDAWNAFVVEYEIIYIHTDEVIA